MAFFDEYKSRVLTAAESSGWSIYLKSGKEPLKRSDELKKNMVYVLRPTKPLDKKPVLKFYNKKDTLESFLLETSWVDLALVKSGEQKMISYRHFVEMLEGMDKPFYFSDSPKTGISMNENQNPDD